MRGIESKDDATRLHVVRVDETGNDVVDAQFEACAVLLGRVLSLSDARLSVELPKLRVCDQLFFFSQFYYY